ncbi:MAG: DPP IV N-terminal domain-containing protein [Chitinophagaceae bacterium]
MHKHLFILLLFLSTSLQAQTKKEIVLEDIWKNNTFRQDFVSGFRSMKDGLHYTEMNDSKITKHPFANPQESQELIDLSAIRFDGNKLTILDYQFNDDESKVLLFTEPDHIYRHSTAYKVYIYDLQSKQLQLLNSERVLHPSFSPQSDKVAYVLNNNIYVYNLLNAESFAITDDGQFNIINGNCDWVYEERLLSFTKAYTWDTKATI